MLITVPTGKVIIGLTGKSTGTRPWTPYDGTPYAWWDAKDEGTITKDGSNRVSQVDDKTTNGWDIVQALGAYQPLYVSGDSPHLYFDGVRALGRFDTMGITGNPALTVFVVAENDADATYRILQWGNGSGTSLAVCTDAGIRYNDGNNVWSDSPMLGTTDIGAFTFPAGGAYGDSTFHLNGIEAVVTGQSNPTYTVNIVGTYMGVGVGYTVGGSPTNLFAGKLHEMIVVLAELDEDDRQRYEGYLAWRWGKQTSLPYDHPYRFQRPTTGYDLGALWTPSEVTSAAWWDMSDEATVTKDMSNYVSQVDDKSGNSHHIVQADGSYQPLYANGGSDFGDMNVLRYDGTTKFMENFDTFLVQEIICFIKWSSGVAINGEFAIISNFGGALVVARSGTSEKYEATNAADFGHDLDKWVINGVPDVNPTSITPLYDTAHILGQPYGGEATLGGVFDHLYVGRNTQVSGGRYMLGDIAEIILLPAIFTYSERCYAEGYLAWKYGRPDILPVTHPFKNTPPLLSIDPAAPTTRMIELDVQSLAVGQVTALVSPTFDEFDDATDDGHWTGGVAIGDWFIRADVNPAGNQALEISTTLSGGATDAAALLVSEDRFTICNNVTVRFRTATKRSTGFTRWVKWELMSGRCVVLELYLNGGILYANGVNTGFSTGAADTFKVDPWNSGNILVWDVVSKLYADGSFELNWGGTVYTAPAGSLKCCFIDGFRVNYNRTVGGHGVYLQNLEVFQGLP